MTERSTFSYFVTAARGVSPVLEAELRELGCKTVRTEPGGCRVRGPLELGYRIALWSRVASRVLLHLADYGARDPEALYQGARDVAWEDHLSPDGTLAVDFVGGGEAVDDSRFGAQRIKDAIVDRLREVHGRRPSVARDDPDVRINAFVRGAGVSLAIDLAGDALHRRGWREDAGEAPLRETVAASLLLRAGWPALAREGASLVDPLAGAGTIMLEAAAMAADVAPGLLRERWGFEGWLGHVEDAWAGVRDEALARAKTGLAALRSSFVAADVDPRAIEATRRNAQRWVDALRERGLLEDAEGLPAWVEAVSRHLGAWTTAHVPAAPGLLICNPPYGHRLGTPDQARRTVGDLGRLLRDHFAGWSAVALLGDERDRPALGLPVAESWLVDNGPLQCTAVRLQVPAADAEPDPLATSLRNRVRKNEKKLAPWRKRDRVTCYRVYDADIPEANVAIDRYQEAGGDGAQGSHRVGWAVVQEYEAPSTIDADRAAARLEAVVAAVPDALGIPPEQVVLKQRRRQRERAQYESLGQAGGAFEVEEGGHRFGVELRGHLDTGLFLDHRRVRALVAREVAARPGARFLNLFSYTAAATVYAAKAGARSSTSVDLSNTYLDRARENLSRNGLSGDAHRLIRADALRFLAETELRWEVILVDPPSFSSSKGMRGTLDLQRDHGRLVHDAASRLTEGGVLLFSCHTRRFRLDTELAARWQVDEITRDTTSPDFARRPTHRCWRVGRRP